MQAHKVEENKILKMALKGKMTENELTLTEILIG